MNGEPLEFFESCSVNERGGHFFTTTLLPGHRRSGAFGNAGNDLAKNGLRSLALRVSVKVEYDPMAEHSGCNGVDIFDRKVQASFHQREHASALHERLCAAG